MNRPNRWSDASSDADPVLRAVMRYAQSIEPSRQDVAACAAAVARVESRPESSPAARASVASSARKLSRQSLGWAAVFVFVAAAGAALGMTLAPGFLRRGAAVVVPQHPKPVAVLPRVAPDASVEAPSPLPVPAANPPRRASAVAPASAPPAEAPSELALLTEARKELRARPARTLSLLMTHEQRFPSSSFPEERAALRVEALFELGRTAEAEREYASFSAKFPKSIYALRLAAVRQRR